MTKAIARLAPVLPAHLAQDRVLQRLTDAEAALKEAVTIERVKLVLDFAEAQAVFAKRQQLADEVLGYAHSIQTRALMRLGELLEGVEKATGGTHGGRPKLGTKRVPSSAAPPTLKALGISKKVSAKAQKLARLPGKTVEAIADRKTTLAKAVREQTKVEQLEKVATLSPTEGVYDVLVVDPPWQYDRQPKDSGMRGEVDYLTESLADLKRRELPAADDCVLWLWTTNSFMGEAYELAAAWGFTVKTILTWNKVHMGLGSWLRNVTEHCLVCVKGHPVVTLTNQTTLITEARREHSRKPEAFYALVESLCPGRKWELFARTPRPGWAHEGVEADRFSVEDAV
jgi:N6-adenosine-specific RNA methylase IME4